MLSLVNVLIFILLILFGVFNYNLEDKSVKTFFDNKLSISSDKMTTIGDFCDSESNPTHRTLLVTNDGMVLVYSEQGID